jgi:hypothetical protein
VAALGFAHMDKKKAAEIRDDPMPLLRRYAAAWNRFWFTPADPTLLGLIRICCGAITLYTIVAYSFTLQDLFGKDAWFNHVLIEDFRHKRPTRTGSLGWKQEDPPRAPEPANEFQRHYAEEFKARWNVPYVPDPYPRDAEEAKAFNEYAENWLIDPRVVYARGSSAWSIWYHVTDPTLMAILHGCICVIVFLFMIGLATRITSVLTWAAALWYINRSPLTLFGVDTMMTILLLYLMIGPSGAALSMDRLLARWWAGARPRVLARWRAFWRRGDTEAPLPPTAVPGPPEPSVAANFATRLLQIHVCFIYAAAGLSKLLGPMWWNGTAVWGTLANFEFAPMQYESYMIPLRWLASHRLLWELVITSSGIFTLFFEISYAFLIWRPSTRWLILTMAIILHGFIGVFMGLKTFSLMMLVMNMAFLNPEKVKRFLGIFRRGEPAAEAAWPTFPPSRILSSSPTLKTMGR